MAKIIFTFSHFQQDLKLLKGTNLEHLPSEIHVAYTESDAKSPLPIGLNYTASKGNAQFMEELLKRGSKSKDADYNGFASLVSQIIYYSYYQWANVFDLMN